MRVQCESRVWPVGMLREVRPIAAVADDGVIGLGEMDADLVAAAGVELHADERRVGQSFIDSEVRDGVLAAVGVLDRVPAEPLAGGEVAFVLAGVLFHHSGNEREVLALRSTQSQLILQGSGDLGFLREDQQARCLTIEAMHDEGSVTAAEIARDFIDQRMGFLSLGRNGEDAGLFFDDDQVVILEHDAEGLALELGVRRFALKLAEPRFAIFSLRVVADVDDVTLFDGRAWFGDGLTVDAQAAAQAHAAQLRAGAAGDRLDDQIDSARFFGGDGVGFVFERHRERNLKFQTQESRIQAALR